MEVQGVHEPASCYGLPRHDCSSHGKVIVAKLIFPEHVQNYRGWRITANDSQGLNLHAIMLHHT